MLVEITNETVKIINKGLFSYFTKRRGRSEKRIIERAKIWIEANRKLTTQPIHNQIQI